MNLEFRYEMKKVGNQVNTESNITQSPILSIIVPVYNIEEYLAPCLDSILTQDDSNCEIILVDDGSTDCSAEICDKYASEYPTVTVIHQENCGVSKARNRGLDTARGKYVWFCDGDDIVLDGSLAVLCEAVQIEMPDMVVFAADKVNVNGEKVGVVAVPAYDGNSDHGPLQCGDELYPWNRIVNSKIAKQERFNEEISILEDRDYCYRIAWRCKRVICINQSLYQYLVNRRESAMNSPCVERNIEAIRVHENILKQETKIGHTMPAFYFFAEYVIGTLSLIARTKSSKANFVLVYKYLNKYKNLSSNLIGPLRVKYLLALRCPPVFNLLSIAKRAINNIG